jgi:hypothetical protein
MSKRNWIKEPPAWIYLPLLVIVFAFGYIEASDKFEAILLDVIIIVIFFGKDITSRLGRRK